MALLIIIVPYIFMERNNNPSEDATMNANINATVSTTSEQLSTAPVRPALQRLG